METCNESRLRRLGKFLYGISFVIPTVISLMILIYYNNKYNQNLMKMVERQYYEKIEITNNVLLKIEALQESCSNDETNERFNEFVISYVEEVDRQYGIYGRVLDLNGKLLSTPRVAEGEGELAILMESEDFDFDQDLGFIKESDFGDRYIVSKNNVNVHLHWMRYPVTKEYYYYILIGIVYDRIMVSIDMDTLNTGLIILLSTVIVTMFISIYLYDKLHKAKVKCRNCEHKLKKQ